MSELFDYSEAPSATDKRLARAVEEKYLDNRYNWRIVTDDDTAWQLLNDGESLIICSPESDPGEVAELAELLKVAAVWEREHGPVDPRAAQWGAGGLIEWPAWEVVDYGWGDDEECTISHCPYIYEDGPCPRCGIE